MNNKNEKGFAIILLLVLTAILMLSLSTAIATLCALSNQNKHAKKELSQKENSINCTRK
jgi:flagellar basal body-associated protein FliL